MKNITIKDLINNGLLSFSALWESWYNRDSTSLQIDPAVLDAILCAKPEWLDKSTGGYQFDDHLCIRAYVEGVCFTDVTLLGMATAYGDTSAQDVIRKHYRKLNKSENPIAKIVLNDIKVDLDVDTLTKIRSILYSQELTTKAEVLKQLLTNLGVLVIETPEQILARRHYFTGSVITLMDKILNPDESWCIKEMTPFIDIPGCLYIEKDGNTALHNGPNFFALYGSNIRSAQKIIIQQKSGGSWFGDPIDITSLWPHLQIVVAYQSATYEKFLVSISELFNNQQYATEIYGRKLVTTFAPVFREPGEIENFNIFVKELKEYGNYLREKNNGELPSYVAYFLQRAADLTYWIRYHL